jgi:hypothetical protein
MITVIEIFEDVRFGAAFLSAVNVSAQGLVEVVRICARYCPADPTACVSVSWLLKAIPNVNSPVITPSNIGNVSAISIRAPPSSPRAREAHVPPSGEPARRLRSHAVASLVRPRLKVPACLRKPLEIFILLSPGVACQSFPAPQRSHLQNSLEPARAGT